MGMRQKEIVWSSNLQNPVIHTTHDTELDTTIDHNTLGDKSTCIYCVFVTVTAK